MEAVQENTNGEQPKKESKLIVVVGVDELSKQFLKEAVCQILFLSGYSVNAQEFDKPEDTDFHVITAHDFEIELEAKAAFIFASYRNPEEVIAWEREIDPQSTTSANTMLKRFHELAKWMRTSKLGSCMDYNSPVNSKGLHNYTTLRNLILPMVYQFQSQARMTGKEEPEPGKRYFDKIDPLLLIQQLVPDLAEQSKKASQKFDETVKEKSGDVSNQ